jgi:hypothetical protein
MGLPRCAPSTALGARSRTDAPSRAQTHPPAPPRRARPLLQSNRKFKGAIRMPNAGYGTNKKDRHVLKTGFRKIVVNNVSDLELLMMHNRWVFLGGRGRRVAWVLLPGRRV